MKYIEAIFDCNTQKETFIEREYSLEQIADQTKIAQERADAQAAQTAKLALLEKLGITADEAALLIK